MSELVKQLMEKDGSRWISYDPDDYTVVLDGSFDADELDQIVDEMRRLQSPDTPTKKTIKVGHADRNSAMAMAAQLRLIAELLESGEMVSKSGNIMVNSNHSGDVTIESSLILSCQEQPTVERTTEPATAAQLAIYQSLQVMQVGEVAHLNFDHDEQANCDEWVSVMRNRGEYPPELKGYVFKVDVRKFASNINVRVERLV